MRTVPSESHRFPPDMFLFLAYGRNERGFISSKGFLPSPPPTTPSLLQGLSILSPPWPSKVKSRPIVLLVKPYRAPPLKSPPAPSTIVSGVVSQERTESGSAGNGVHMLLSLLPVSLRLTDICAPEYSTHLFRNAGINILIVFIPFAWVSHFYEWTHGLTFARMS